MSKNKETAKSLRESVARSTAEKPGQGGNYMHPDIKAAFLKKADELEKGAWYHNGSDTFDAPEIVFFSGEQIDQGLPYGFCEGPFSSFSEAKKDLLEHDRRWYRTAFDAIRLAKQIRKGKKS